MLVLMQFLLQPDGHRRRPQTQLAVECLSDLAIPVNYEQNATDDLSTTIVDKQ